MDMKARPKPRNVLHLAFHPAGMRPFVADWPATARMLIACVRNEALGRVIDAGTRRLPDELARYPGVDASVRAEEADSRLPMIPLTFVKDGVTLRYFSLITTIGTPQAVAAQELRLGIHVAGRRRRRHVAFVAAHA